MEMPREFHTFGNKSIDINSIINITKLSTTSYRVSMSNADVMEIDGEERCEQLLTIVQSRLGVVFE